MERVMRIERDYLAARALADDAALALSELRRLEQHHLRVLQFVPGARTGLRCSVQRIARRLKAHGRSADEGHRILMLMAQHGPTHDFSRRASLLRPEPSSPALFEVMRHWFDNAFDDGCDD